MVGQGGRLLGRGLLAAASVWATSAQAGHGIGVVGFGAESLAMAGTDIAVARDSAAVNINPAALVQIESQGFDVYISPFHTLNMKHRDQYGNNQLNDNALGASAAGSYARRLESLPDVVIGAGLFLQGGTGMVYEDLYTPFGNQDDIHTILGISKLVAGAGWQVSENLSLGANLGYFYGVARQKFFPDTSVADAGFYGLRLDSGTGSAINFALGLRYEFSEAWTLGVAYSSKADLPISGATMTMNFESLNLGRAEYQDARLDGFAISPVLGVGLSWKPHADLLVAFEYEWFDHSSSLQATRLRAKNPRGAVPAGLETIELNNTLGWRDQYVRSIGVAWQYSDKTVLRAGYDYINNPIPPRHMTPLLNIIQGGEVTAGIGRRFGRGWSFDTTLQYQLRRDARYNNPELPFGAGAREVFECVIITAAIGRRW